MDKKEGIKSLRITLVDIPSCLQSQGARDICWIFDNDHDDDDDANDNNDNNHSEHDDNNHDDEHLVL